MKLSALRSVRIWLPAIAIVLAFGAYVCSAPLRLALAGLGTEASSRTQLVAARHYDAEWFDAARAGRVDILSALVDAGYPIDARTKSGYTALILTAYDAKPEALAYLLQKGANPCLGDRNGNTALMGALYKGELAIANMLVRTSCPVDQVNNAGETALSFAVLFGRLDAIGVLIAHGADASHRDGNGDTPAQIALKQGNASSLAALSTHASRSH